MDLFALAEPELGRAVSGLTEADLLLSLSKGFTPLPMRTAALLDELPKAQCLLADRGYDADWFRDALQEKGIAPASPAANPAARPPNSKCRYKRRDHVRPSQGLATGRDNPTTGAPKAL